ncbi:hypothetical protein C0V77_07085 [Emticicia sp. TH156]|nr:hypothetical protein C0V77_07085 [Emticicia sp. TH156]
MHSAFLKPKQLQINNYYLKNKGNLKPRIRNCLPLKKNGLPIKSLMTPTKDGSPQLTAIDSL